MSLRGDMLTDLDTIYDDDGYAVEGTLTGGTKINVMFRINRADILGVESAGIFISGKYADLSGCDQGDTIVIGGTTYYFMDTPQDTGTGRAKAKLSKGTP